MKFSTGEIGVTSEDVKKYAVPKFAPLILLRLTESDTDVPVPGCKNMKQGLYELFKTRKSYVPNGGMVYELRRLGAKGVHCIDNRAIDKMFDLGIIVPGKF